MTVAVDFAAALVGLRPPDAAAKSKRPAFSKPRQRSTQNPRGAVQITGASSIADRSDYLHQIARVDSFAIHKIDILSRPGLYVRTKK
ncbi:hypothetical protein [Methylocystis echinoides]|uniref:hypothetical protein n=1 Tax=Methylocystis echinoides TaxID=29468 RepID=UPI00344589C6